MWTHAHLWMFLFVAAAMVLSPSYGADFFRPEAPLHVDTWTNATAPWFLYPEQSPSSSYYMTNLMARPNIGISISGGGYRAAALALGYIRALHQLGVLHQARYLSSNSGGSWFNTVFSYQDMMPPSAFLGTYIPPAKLTRQLLSGVADGTPHGHFAFVLRKAGVKVQAVVGGLSAAALTGSNISRPGGWTEAISAAFLAPYGLDAAASTWTAAGSKGPIHPGARQLGQSVRTYVYDGRGPQSRPYPIIVGSLHSHSMAPPSSKFFPIEFTPQYIGVPPVVDSSQPSGVIGGGLVEPVGFNSAPPSTPPTLPAPLLASSSSTSSSSVSAAQVASQLSPRVNTESSSPTRRQRALTLLRTTVAALLHTNAAPGTSRAPRSTAATHPAASAAPGSSALNTQLPVQVTVQSAGVIPLKVAAGISSSAAAQVVAVLPAQVSPAAVKALVGTEAAQYWNQVNFQGTVHGFTDGAATDNYAITPLLRRKVQVIIACIANASPLSADTNMNDFASRLADVAALFGAVPKTTAVNRLTGFGAQAMNKRMQVFPTDGWQALFHGLVASSKAGGPTHHLAEYTVMDNALYAVVGGWKVKVLWVFNAQQTRWEQQLPSETSSLLAAARAAKKGASDKTLAKGLGLSGYPYINTARTSFSLELTALLSQQASWQMMALQPTLHQLTRAASRGSP